jgi:hypothetical protein
MRSPLVRPLAPLLVLATVACTSLGPSALADPPDPRSSPYAPPVLSVPRVEVVDDDMRTLPTFMHTGRRFVLGSVGERYSIRVVNPTPVRVEAVVSIDGLDAMDGRPASLTKRGYLIPAYGEVTIDGWRTSLEKVAAFRFSSVRASYAARTRHDQNVGVIGVACFRERAAVVRPAFKASRSAPAPAPAAEGAAAPSAADEARAGLGTEFGESHESSVTEVAFERASGVPDSVAELRYDDRDGLEARGIRVVPRTARDDENDRRDRAAAFPESRFAQPPR